jgi:hypothetical protein
VKKYGRAREATDDNTAHALGMLAKYGYTHSQYVILIAFPRQECLHERASLLWNTYSAFLGTSLSEFCPSNSHLFSHSTNIHCWE